MPRIVAADHALPPYRISQPEVRNAVEEMFADKFPELPRLLNLFENTRIDFRHFMRPPEWYRTDRSPAERNAIYLQEGFSLLCRSARRCLEKAALSPQEVDHVISVSSTGYATPTLDARLINTLKMNPTTTRAPLWGLGCAAGAVGIARALDYCLAHPDARVLVAALECCSLTFLGSDISKKNLVATAIFADGAASVLISGDRAGGRGPRLKASRSWLFPNSDRIMGWDFGNEGMELVLSPRLAALVRKELPGLVDGLLDREGISRSDIVHFVTHPGGARIVDAYRYALGLKENELELTEEVLRESGNISSVSVLAVLEKWLAQAPENRPGYGLLSAFGPGFSAETILMEV